MSWNHCVAKCFYITWCLLKTPLDGKSQCVLNNIGLTQTCFTIFLLCVALCQCIRGRNNDVLVALGKMETFVYALYV